MKRILFRLHVFLPFLFLFEGITYSQVQPVGIPVDLQVSIDGTEICYNMMMSHMTESDRQNRFLSWDGTSLVTEKFDAGIPADNQSEKYLWKLIRGSPIIWYISKVWQASVCLLQVRLLLVQIPL